MDPIALISEWEVTTRRSYGLQHVHSSTVLQAIISVSKLSGGNLLYGSHSVAVNAYCFLVVYVFALAFTYLRGVEMTL